MNKKTTAFVYLISIFDTISSDLSQKINIKFNSHFSPTYPDIPTVLATLRAHLMTVGVISAQKKMLSVLTAWEENIPMMENATENFLFRLSRRTAHRNENSESSLRKP